VLARIGSATYWGFVVVVAAAMFPLAVATWLVTLPFDRRRVVLHRFTCLWASLYTWFSPVWSVHVVGRERVDPRRTYVMVANHLSLVDIFVLFRLWVHYKWVSKAENFSIPFIGWNMRLNEYVPLQRGDRESVLQMFDHCRRTLRSGSSIMMFPEGTRSKTGALKPFKPGAFELALELGLPVLPIVIQGSHEALPKKGFTIRPQKIRVTVLDAVEPESFAGTTAEALAERVRDVIARFQTEHPHPATKTGGGG
jgi:1-acyl-sn-glycerol-3-phosphate acyltransferase